MISFPPEFIRKQIQPGKVYRFTDTIPNGSNAIANHWHICFKVKDEIVYLLCCTSRETTIDNYLRFNNLDRKTKVHIAPTKDNGLERDTFLNCNTVKFCEIEDLVDLLHNGEVRYTGVIEEEDFQRIRIGILSSSVVEPYIQELVRSEDDA